MKRLIALLPCLLLSFTVSAQELEPSEPDVELPPMLLQIEDLYEEQIQAALPEYDDSLSYEIEVPLPKPPSVDVPDLSLPLGIPGPGQAGNGEAKEPAPFFTNGKIGIGSMNNILGNITLYKLGEDPHFHLQFIHEKTDGYNFRQAGGGFYHQENTLAGGFSVKPENMYLDVNASYGEINEGLQNLGPFSSVQHKPITADTQFIYDRGGLFSLKSEFDIAFTQETLSGTNPVNTSELSLIPGIRAGLTLDPVQFGLSAEYEFRNASGASSSLHRIRATLDGNAELKNDLSFGGALSIDWHTNKQLEIPFSIFFEKGFTDILSFRIEGGYETKLVRYLDLWKDFAFYELYQNIPYPDISRWYAKGGLEWNIVKQLTFSLSGAFSRYTSAVLADSSIDSTTGLTGFTLGTLSEMKTTAGILWETLQWLSLSLEWTGRFIQHMPTDPGQLLNLEVRMHTPSGKWGGSVNGNFSVFDTPRIPELNVSAFFAPSEGVEFTLQALDVLSPAATGGRMGWAYYELPGFQIVFFTSISL